MKKSFIFLGIFLGVLLLTGCVKQTTTPITPTEQEKVVPSVEGGTCIQDANCQAGLKCISNKCSSGKVGSVCATYKDCNTGLYCIKSTCSNPPSYTKYFNKIVIAKMKPEPPGPKNIPVPATEFKAATEALEIDVTPQAGVTGELYYELINSTTGMTEMSTASNKMKIQGQPTGTGFIIPANLVGDFELNIYFNNELIHTASVKISQ